MMTRRLLLTFFILFIVCGEADSKKEWNKHKGRHFIIYYKDAPEDFVKTVEEWAEHYYDEITDNLGFTRYKGWSWEDRAQIYIYSDQEDYVNSSQQANWSHGAAYTRKKIIRTFPTAHGFFDSTLPHELGHIIFREFVGFRTQIPGWFEEGVAMYQEKAKRFGSNRIVKESIDIGTFIPLEQLTYVRLTGNTPKDKVDLFYAESASIVYYLIHEQGKHRFVRFCRKLKEGKPFEWALEEVYVRFRKIEDLNKAWVKYLQ